MNEYERRRIWEGFDHMAKHFSYTGRNLEIAKSAYYIGFTNMRNIQYEEKTKAKDENRWYCDTCKSIIDPVNVRNDETCEFCNSHLS